MNKTKHMLCMALLSFFLIGGIADSAQVWASAAPWVNPPANFSASGYTYNRIKLKWNPAADVSGYQIYRSERKKGTYKTVKRVDSAVTSFLDKKRKPGRRYYYKIRSYKNVSGSLIYSKYSKVCSAKAATAKPGNFKASPTTVSDRAKLSWTKAPDVSSYKIYRAASKNGKYKIIKTVSKNKQVYYDKSRKKGAVYYYKIRAVKKVGRKSYYSAFSPKKSVCVKNKISGKSKATAEELAAYYREYAKYPSYYAANGKDKSVNTIDKFCQIYVEECNAEGIRAEVAFCQTMLETGWLTFKGDVKISQFNFAGLGATGNNRKGSSFSTVRKGVRAQIQHLKAYSSKAPLKKACVDPRFKYVKRGSAAYVEWLGIQENPKKRGWAAKSRYGYRIMELVRKI